MWLAKTLCLSQTIRRLQKVAQAKKQLLTREGGDQSGISSCFILHVIGRTFILRTFRRLQKNCTSTKPFAHKGLSGPIKDKLFFYLACDWPKLYLESKHSGGGCKKGAQAKNQLLTREGGAFEPAVIILAHICHASWRFNFNFSIFFNFQFSIFSILLQHEDKYYKRFGPDAYLHI